MGSERLLTQFQNKPNMVAFVDAISDEFKELQTAGDELQTKTTIDGAEGVNIDKNAVDHGLPGRMGLTDANLKKVTKMEGFIRASEGTGEDVIRVAKLMGEAFSTEGPVSPRIQFTEDFPAGIVVTIETLIDMDFADFIGQAIRRTKLGGVRTVFIIQTAVSGDAWAFAGPTTAFKGFSGVNSPTSGGKLAGIIFAS